MIAIDSINHIVWEEKETISFSLSYEYEGSLKSIINEFDALIISNRYSDKIDMTVTIDSVNLDKFLEEIRNSSSGKIEVSNK